MNRTCKPGRTRAAVVTESDANVSSMPNRWYARVGLLLLGTLLLSLSFAPESLYFLAWVGLVPWLLVVVGTASYKSAFAWGFVGGWMFYLANMWWLWPVSAAGMVALTVYLAIFWGFAAMFVRLVIRGATHKCGCLVILSKAKDLQDRAGSTLKMLRFAQHDSVAIFLIAIGFTAIEWLRGNVSFLGKQGLPWLYLGQTQSPLLVMCQIADITSVMGITFWVVLVNALIAASLLHVNRLRQMAPAIVSVGIIVLSIGVYGAYRMTQRTTQPGPAVMVVQSNYPQSNTGEKGAPIDEIVRFHLRTTRRALEECASRGQRVDLVVWSETMMPSINRSAREFARNTNVGRFWQDTCEAISDLAAEFRTSMLVGGIFQDDWSVQGDRVVAADRRNSAYFFDFTGTLREERYDKLHLVPFGEYIPFESIPPIYSLFVKLGPNYYEDYILTPGTEVTVFSLQTMEGGGQSRFVVPICFEDIVPSLVAYMFDGKGAGKRADMLVNVTNDGWFRANQMPQHLQAAVFRSLENRVPTARSVNTGISGFVDSVGRVSNSIAPGTEGWALAQLALDSRVAPYTKIGDVFALACVTITASAIGLMVYKNRRAGGASAGRDVE